MKKLHVFSIMLLGLTLLGSCEKQDRFDKFQPEKEAIVDKTPILKNAVWPGEGCNQRTYDLMAGQTIFAGSVHTIVDEVTGMLYVKYEAAEDCKFTEAHLFVGGEEATIPATKSGNPKIGHFPYFWEGPGMEEEVVFSIALADLELEVGDCMKIAAHAVVECPNGEETAWAKEGLVFAIKSLTAMSWAITGKDAGGWSDNFRYYSIAEGLMGPIELVDYDDGITVRGTVEVEEDDGMLAFTITPEAAPVYYSSLYVGPISGFSIDYPNFPYQTGNREDPESTPSPVHVFSDIPMPEVNSFEGSRWGWYVIYCPVCEED